jgi:hypothetical protein
VVKAVLLVTAVMPSKFHLLGTSILGRSVTVTIMPSMKEY